MLSTMEKLLQLLLDHPGLEREVFIPCCLYGLVEREDDSAVELIPSALLVNAPGAAQRTPYPQT